MMFDGKKKKNVNNFQIAKRQTLLPVVNFINNLCGNFTYKSLFGSFFYLHVTRETLSKRRSYKKVAQKMLMKLTPALIVPISPFS